jgi:uncharacterized alkaline shock family protein YloU
VEKITCAAASGYDSFTEEKKKKKIDIDLYVTHEYGVSCPPCAERKSNVKYRWRK